MISRREALDRVLARAERQPAEQVLLLEAAGRVLAEDIAADHDVPPFPRSSMDGYAVRAADVTNVPATLEVVGLVAAGVTPDFEVQTGQAAKIMTGAPVPPGADAVVMVERTARPDSQHVEIQAAVLAGSNIAPLGTEAKAGQIVARAGTYITPAVISVLATFGRNVVKAYRAPSVAILASGDEIVDVSKTPATSQIRNSNSYCLFVQVNQAGAKPSLLGIAGDDKSVLRAKVTEGLKYDVLLTTGGVSMGDLDLLEEVFSGSGCEVYFNKVAVKPGKPMVFAKAGGTLIFGLPGNPVSAATTFELFVRPAIRKMMGFTTFELPVVKARLADNFQNRSEREYYAVAVTKYADGNYLTQPLRSKGSADIFAFGQSNSYLICPRDRTEFVAGEEVEVLLRTEAFSGH